MTIGEAIAFLKKLERGYGADTKVYFDCPHCAASFTPATVETKAVVIRAEAKKP